MSFSLIPKLREIVFWSKDMLLGAKIRTAYKELSMIDSLPSDSIFIKEYQRKALMNLLNHAQNTTQFYRGKGIGLSNYEVIDKNKIKFSTNAFLSSKFNRDELITMSTSGSTGTPFNAYQCKDKKKRVNAEIIYYSEKAGYKLGAKLFYLRALTSRSNKSKFKQWVQNEKLIDITNLDETNIKVIIKELESSKNSVCLAYASTYDAIKQYLVSNKISNNPHSRINGFLSGAEMLYDDTRKALEDYFNCKVISRYSNQENVVIGQDELENNVFVINEAHYLIEIFKINENVVVEDGKVGRIVITDLYNYAMPMIRYDTGDIGAITTVFRDGVNKRAIFKFGGRKVDMIFDNQGNQVSPHSITNNLWEFSEIRQFQFKQYTEAKYAILLNTDSVFNRESELISSLKNILGQDIDIEIIYVNEIPVLNSGKRKYIVNEMLD